MQQARDIERGSLRVSLWAGKGNEVRLSGVMREANPGEWLEPLIMEIHTCALELRLTEVILDLRELEYANAALWRCLVIWLKRLQGGAQVSYKLRLRSDPKHSWQQIGVPMLLAFALDARGTERLIIEGIER